MISILKKRLYFPIAGYFKFFAKIRLYFWKPYIIVVTGSNGKTSLLYLIESQLKDKAKYSHEANSSFGIPFDILDIHRKELVPKEWLTIIFLPFINLFKPFPRQKYYVVEADCDRPNEGRFLSGLLKPNITLWTNIARTHSMNFEDTVSGTSSDRLERAIAYEFGYFAERTKNYLIVNADNTFEMDQVKRSSSEISYVSLKNNLHSYKLLKARTVFLLSGKRYELNYLVPEEFGASILMCKALLNYLGEPFDKSLRGFKLPPGRNSVFKGIKNTTLVDSSYNANLNSMHAILNMFSKIKGAKKWVVLGDMLEQGKNEAAEHENLAKMIVKYNFSKVILMGPRISEYTKPQLEKLTGKSVVSFIYPKDVLEYLKENIRGGEIILFKGARFLEGVIENLLLEKSDARLLARREKIWELRRKKWGLK